MTLKPSLLVALSLCVSIAVVVGCQTYDFAPVQPLAITQATTVLTINAVAAKPNLMFLVDRSGSMTLPFNTKQEDGTTNSFCFPGDSGTAADVCGNQSVTTTKIQCTAQCPSRWDTLSSTTGNFLTSNGTVARMGLTFFPHTENVAGISSACGAPASGAGMGGIDVPLATDDAASVLVANATLIQNKIQGVIQFGNSSNASRVAGGTPTAESVNFVVNAGGWDTSPNHRENLIVLLTDGLPNCNSKFQPKYPDPACGCVESDPNVCNANPVLLCNDFGNATTAIGGAAAKGINTVVVGYGSLQGGAGGDLLSGAAATSLQSMAVAGGFQRRCYTDGGECATTDLSCFEASILKDKSNSCPRQFFAVQTQDQLAAALKAITAAIVTGDPCQVTFDNLPSDPRLVSVVITDNNVITSYPYPSPTVWAYAGAANGGAASSINFVEPLCSKIKSRVDTISYEVRVATLIK